MTETDVLLLVRAETRAHHQKLETKLPFDERLNLARYQELLAKFWGLFDPLEAALANLDLADSLEVRKRQRSALLIRDLQATGLTSQQLSVLPRCDHVPRLNTNAQALGCMYVLEGSRLGGQFVSKLVLQQLGLTERSGCSFFSSDGAEVAPMWRKFCDIVRESVHSPEDRSKFVVAARSTFAAFLEWIERRDAKLV
jgi:heme oxygenase